MVIDRLEKFEAPSSWRDLVPGAAILIAAVVAIAALEATVEPEPKIPQQAGAAERPLPQRRVLPLSNPLGCPKEDVWGRTIHMTIIVNGSEDKPTCIYTGEVKYK